MDIQFKAGDLDPDDRTRITKGFDRDTAAKKAPPYDKKRLNWTARDPDGRFIGALTAETLWDWLYVDELWIDPAARGQGLGTSLMWAAERYADQHRLTGVWLWTQSWQAEDFYKKLGYEVFTRFPDNPKGHSSIGLRKHFSS